MMRGADAGMISKGMVMMITMEPCIHRVQVHAGGSV